MTTESFALALTKARQTRGLSQSGLGRALGRGRQSTVSGWEAGESIPPPDTVFALERVLDLPPGSLSRHLGYTPVECTEKLKPPSTLQAIIEDPELDDLARRLLLAMFKELKPKRRRTQSD